jgi:4-amino-4-deoxy-L-arabinose transferase-like glycosyltransferase
MATSLTSGLSRAHARATEHSRPETAPATRTAARPAVLLALAFALVSGLLAMAASTRNSTTFDEIVMMAGGARGYETGRWDLTPEHPPLTQYLYGLPIWLSNPTLAPEMPFAEGEALPFGYRYYWSQQFFWLAGNDPERLAFLGRIPAALCAVAMVLLVFGFANRHFGPVAGTFAAGTVAFLPDLLAHSGVAYNDVPLALGYLAALWAADAAARRPGIRTGAVFGLLFGLALGVKFSAVVIGPAAVALLVAEGISRGKDGKWARSVAPAVLAATAATYLTLVAIYRGDPTLAEFFYGLDYTFGHVSEGHGASAYLLGQTSTEGWWYYFPVAFLYKTPAALHLLLLAGLVAFARSARTGWRDALRAPLRMPVIALVAFGAALFASNLAIGFRYALPVVPILCLIAAAGVARLWEVSARPARALLVVLLVWQAGSVISFYPYFLAYTSEYGSGRDEGHRLLVDSSLDWGQGLLAVRDWMQAEDVDRIYLSYFGSAIPAGYGLDYVPLASFFPLRAPGPEPEVKPEWIVVSATNLRGVYLPGDPFAVLRGREPDTVLAHTMMVYRIIE